MIKVIVDWNKFVDIICDYLSVDAVLEIIDIMNDNDVFLDDVFED